MSMCMFMKTECLADLLLRNLCWCHWHLRHGQACSLRGVNYDTFLVHNTAVQCVTNCTYTHLDTVFAKNCLKSARVYAVSSPVPLSCSVGCRMAENYFYFTTTHAGNEGPWPGYGGTSCRYTTALFLGLHPLC